ncbi:HAD family hydrolase [Ruminiclostridium papyrosolvens]|uniref:Haloacid dehalogenase n=1 Tax=Ruminiclostridium papyrosolvens C7 TaxID=1330534 RepID=U4R2G6_9FIRM|nr:HAD family hydrolase [Ruminiclostridium papyrosolvens]EPR12329.1 hypothetical protein L323_08255 [Ruminiclostridium papyrosolvens C7]
MGKKYILWDFDNTLAYRNGMWGQVIYDLLREFGYKDVTLNDIKQYLNYGFPWHSPNTPHTEFFKGTPWWDHMTLHFENILREIGVKENLSYKVASQIKVRYLDVTQWQLYDDTIPCLENTKNKGYHNIIVSNHVPELTLLVDELGISRFFEGIYSSADIGFEKPNIQAYKKVMSELRDVCEATMIGDSYDADILGAVNAGINAILVRKENSHNYKKYCENLMDIFEFI